MTREEALEIVRAEGQEDKVEITGDKIYYLSKGTLKGYKLLRNIENPRELLPDLPKHRVEDVLLYYKSVVGKEVTLERAKQILYLDRFPEEIVEQTFKKVFND